MPRALLSVSDKTGIVDFGRGLTARGFELISTGGTARALAEAGLAVTAVSTLTGFPEMMEGRVKTLHPALHAGILARRSRTEDLSALHAHGLGLIDLVAVNLYPFVRAAANPATRFDDLIEEIDIGGPSLVRAAAKNFQDVLVVVDPADYQQVLSALDAGPTSRFRFELMQKAFAQTAAYDTAISGTLGTFAPNGGEFERLAADTSSSLGPTIDLSLDKIRDLRYGENPHQAAAWYVRRALRFSPPGSDPGRGDNASAPRAGAPESDSGADGKVGRTGLGAATILQGKELSYTNLLDLDAAARIVLEFDEPAAVVVKHTNPCGVATADTPVDAYVSARDADPLSAFGGIVALNRPIDPAVAEAITSTFIEAVVAPGVAPGARDILARKAKLRVVVTDFLPLRQHGFDARTILGAVLVQERDRVSEAELSWPSTAVPELLRVVTVRQPTLEEWHGLRFAWRIAAHVKSNAVIFTTATRTLAVGAGQMSRVDAVDVAVMKARARSGVIDRPLAGSVAASDAYFPFRDGLDAIAAAGATAVVQPGGSVRDAEVIAAADEHGLAMVFAGRRHFRH